MKVSGVFARWRRGASQAEADTPHRISPEYVDDDCVWIAVCSCGAFRGVWLSKADCEAAFSRHVEASS